MVPLKLDFFILLLNLFLLKAGVSISAPFEFINVC